MFVSIICEFSTDDHKKEMENLLKMYGFSKIMNAVFESSRVGEQNLLRLKRDIDKITDSYDVIRLYQYPVAGTLVLSSLKDKKWRKIKLMP